MSTRIADTLGQMGEGNYPLVHAKDVDVKDGTDLQTYLDNFDAKTTAENVSYTNEQYGDMDNVKEWLDDVLDELHYYPIEINNFYSNPVSSGYFEFGKSIPDIKLTWELNKEPKSQSISSIGEIDADIREIEYKEPFVNVNKTFTLTVSDGKTSVSNSKTFRFAPNVYWGSSALKELYDSEWVLGLSSKALKISASGTYDYNIASEQYGFIVIPSNYQFSGVVKIGGFDTELVYVNEISVTNRYDYVLNYKIYRTQQNSLGKITMVI